MVEKMGIRLSLGYIGAKLLYTELERRLESTWTEDDRFLVYIQS
jgi:hypothetical protein